MPQHFAFDSVFLLRYARFDLFCICVATFRHLLPESIVAAQSCRIKVDVPGPNGKGWKRTNAEIDTQECLDDSMKEDLRSGARFLLEETWVPANDCHFDAKCWPCVDSRLKMPQPTIYFAFLAIPQAQLRHSSNTINSCC